MSRGQKIILVVIAGLILIAAIFYFVVWPIFAPAPGASGNANANGNANEPVAAANANLPSVDQGTPVAAPAEVPAELKQSAALRTVAKMFAERLGTYSNQAGLDFTALELITEKSTYGYLDGEYRAALKKSLPPAATYYGVTSTVVGMEVGATGAQTAEGTVDVQKAESGTVRKTSNAALKLKFVKSGDAWLVSYFKWQ